MINAEVRRQNEKPEKMNALLHSYFCILTSAFYFCILMPSVFHCAHPDAGCENGHGLVHPRRARSNNLILHQPENWRLELLVLTTSPRLLRWPEPQCAG